jgi:hypothetical protein
MIEDFLLTLLLTDEIRGAYETAFPEDFMDEGDVAGIAANNHIFGVDEFPEY